MTSADRRLSTRKALGALGAATLACAAFALLPAQLARADSSTATSASDSLGSAEALAPAASSPTTTAASSAGDDVLSTATTNASGGSDATEMNVTTTTAPTPTTAGPTTTTTKPPEASTTTTQPPTTTTATTDPDTLGEVGKSPAGTTSTTAAPPPTEPAPTTTVPPTTTGTGPTTTATPATTTPSSTTAAPNPAPRGTAAPVGTSGTTGSTSRAATGGSGQSATSPTRSSTKIIGDVAVDMPSPGPTPKIARGQVVEARIVADQDQLDDFALAPTGTRSPNGSSELLISVNLPGRDTQIGISLRPSRVATAWVAWLLVTLLVMAFWLPLPRLRRRGPRGSVGSEALVPAVDPQRARHATDGDERRVR